MATGTGRGDWPVGPWRLTAPESYVLLHGPRARGAEALKLALLELVARGTLRLVRQVRDGFWHEKIEPALARGENGALPDSAVLNAVHYLYREQAAKTAEPSVLIKDVARAAAAEWGGLGGFTERVVLPALVSRGLYRREAYRILWVFPARRFVPTPEGLAARADLERLLRIGREEAGEWSGPRAGQALAFAGLAGAAVLLLQPIPPELRQLRREQQGGDGSSSGSGGDGADRDDEPPAEPGSGAPPAQEFGDLPPDLALDLDLGAFDAFDGIDGAFAAVDAGVDSGGGDGGGGGGGGDGGGGGGGGE